MKIKKVIKSSLAKAAMNWAKAMLPKTNKTLYKAAMNGARALLNKKK